jgi:hypothetical protein
MPPPADDILRIGEHPGIRNLRFIVLASASLSAALGAPASIPFAALGAGDWSWPLGVLSVWLLFTAALLLGVSLAYGVIEWSPRQRTASLRRHPLSLRRRTVPIDAITQAWRSLSSGSNGAGYLVYRFTSTDGATSRVLVQGRPMSGLDAQGLRTLAAFVGDLPLEVPDAAGRAPRDGSGNAAGRDHDGSPALTERQQAIAVSLTTGGGKSRVGRDTLLEELATLIDFAELTDQIGFGDSSGNTPGTVEQGGTVEQAAMREQTGKRGQAGQRGQAETARAGARAPASHPRGGQPARATTRRRRGGIRALIAFVRSERLDRAWERDDAEALELLAANPSPTARIRRLLLRLLVGSIAIALLAIVGAVILEAVGARLLDADTNDIVALLFGCAILLSAVLYLAWCAAADADVRHRRRLARSWMAGRDDDERERGMAAPLLLAWGEPERRLRVAVASVLCLVGSTAIIAAFFVFSETELPRLTGVGVLVSGLALEVLGVVTFIRVTRGRRADAEEMVYMGGQRLLPPAN